jgi:uncharacterized protein YfaS (alpha-2-macroglobulin family)
MPHARRLLLLVALIAAAGCERCASDRGPLVPGADRPPLELSPLPLPPVVDVAPGALPGVPAGPLAAVVLRPQGELVGRQRPTLTFNKPVVPLGAVAAALPPPAVIEPAVDGSWRWVGSTTAEFVPRAPLPWASTFVVRVDPTLKALDGQGQAAPASFTFTTLRPAVVDVEPTRGWAWVDPDKPLKVTFNQPVQGLEQAALSAADARVAFTVARVVDVDEEEAARVGRRPAGRTPFGRPTRYELALRGPLPPGATLRLALDGVRGVEGPLAITAETLQWRVRGPMRVVSARMCAARDEQPRDCPQGPLVLVTTNEPDLPALQARLRVRVGSGPDAGKDVALERDAIDVHLGWADADEDRPWLIVVGGAFQPATAYDVVVDAGLVDDAGGAAPAFTARVSTTDVEPWLRVPEPLALLEVSPSPTPSPTDGALPVETANVEAIQASIWPLDVAGMARFLAERRWGSSSDDPPPPGPAVARTVKVEARRNRYVRTPLPVAAALPAGPKLFVAEVWADATRETAQRRRVTGQITDLAVHSKLGATASLVWVTTLSSGRPVEGAVVGVWDAAGARRHEATTDADGLARLPGAVDMLGPDADTDDNWSTPFALVAATKGDDTGVTLASWEGDLAPWVSRTWDGNVPDVELVVFAERGIYRPGETVHVKGVVRERSRGALRLPAAGSSLRLRLGHDDGAPVVDRRVKLSRFGTFHADLPLPKDAALGWWQARVDGTLEGRTAEAGSSRPVDGSAGFRVEEYRAPQFKVDVTTATARLLSGQPLRATVEARLLFGAPMPGASAEATVTRTPTAFAPPAHDDFTFGIHTDGWGDTEPQASADVFARAEGAIGADGAWVVDAGAVEASGGRTWSYDVEVEVKDVSRQAVADRASVLVHPAAVYAGVKVADGVGTAGQATTLQLVAVDLEGKRVAGRPLAVTVLRREWKNVRRRAAWSSSYERASEPIDTAVGGCPAVVSADAPVPCAFTPTAPGLHIVEAVVVDDAGRRQRTRSFFYVAGSGWVSWRQGDDDRLELVADRAAYAPGDTARIVVKSPWPRAEAIVTVEREGVKSARRVSLQGAATAVDVPLDDGDAPNVFVGVVVVRGRVAEADVPATDGRPGDIDPGRPQVRVGMVELKVAAKQKQLGVVVDAGPGPHRPGAKVALAVRVTDHAGRGVPAEVTLWAVDEAVLRLTGYTPPDLAAAFHPPRGLSVRLGESLIHLVRRRSWGTKGEPGGDGGEAVGGFRSNFQTTALFLPAVVTDGDGRARVEATLPDDLTTYRLMAVAVAADDRFGGGTADVVVQKPVMALPALPRLARVGDRFEAGVVVHALQPGPVVVRAVAEGGLRLVDNAERTVDVVDRGVEVRFPFVAEAEGRARLRFSVEQQGRGGPERDGVEVALPVRLPVVLETTAVAGMTDDRREEALTPPGASRADVGGLEVTLASTALAGSREAMRQLVEYPHGCAEQLASRLVPFLALRELRAGFGEPQPQGSDADVAGAVRWLGPQILDEQGNAQPDRVIATTIERLQALQQDHGGFRLWSSSRCASPATSAWASLALARAAALGYPVDGKRLDRALAFLQTRVLPDRLPRCDGAVQPASTADRVLAGFVLARAGRPTVAPLQQIAADVLRAPASLSLFDRALLADALVVGRGDAGLARQVLQTVLNAARPGARDVHFEEDAAARRHDPWASDLRTTAVVLMTLAAATPDHPFVPGIARWLEGARQRDGRYRTTQEAAWALFAFSELVRAKERTPPSFAAAVTLGDQRLLQDEFRGRSLDVAVHRVPMTDVLARGAAPLPFVFSREGTGTLYYSAVLRRAPVALPTTPVERGFTVQRFVEPIDDASVHGATAWAGDLVRVRVRVATRDARRDVAIDVPLPAGLEAVDTTLATTAAHGRADTTASADDEGGDEGGDVDGEAGGDDEDDDGAGWFWSPFVHSAKRDDRVAFYADELPPGVHTLTFVARATTVGTWALLPAEATEMYAPEVFGRSDGGTFTVRAPP